VTQDSDFGKLALLRGEPIIGIVFLRPGHFDAQFTIGTLESLLNSNPELRPPFLMVARRVGDRVTIRIRAVP
jgi:hypothetical protein